VLAPLGLLAVVAAPQSQAQGDSPHSGRLGFVLDADLEWGGDNVVEVFYQNGSTQNIKAGQGVTLSVGAHYRPISVPIDFAATVGYKFVGAADTNSNLGIYRVVWKLTGTYELPRHFWVDAGPVWHTGVKLKGDGYVPDIPFNDAVGVTIGAGWRWFGLSYTDIKYSASGLYAGDVDASNVGLTFTFKF
jgi:hypothetical protein